MENFSFLPYLLIIISVLTGIGGIVFLIIGLVQNKRYLWLPGAIVFSIALLIGISGIIFSIKSIVNKITENYGNFNNINKHVSCTYSDTLSDNNNLVDSTFAEPISGFIEDKDKSLIFIKVFPKKDFIVNGIKFEKVSKGEADQNNDQAISVMLNFERTYSGKIKLTLFDYEKNELGSGSAGVNKKSGEIGNINFLFPDNINFSIIDYCTLTFE